MKKVLFFCYFFFLLNNAFSQTTEISIENFRNNLKNAPFESKGNTTLRTAPRADLKIQLPLPDGTKNTYFVVENQVMSLELASQFPEIKTYNLYSSVEKSIQTGTLTTSPSGIYGQLYTEKGNVMIAPKKVYTNLHQVVYEKLSDNIEASCKTAHEHQNPLLKQKNRQIEGVNNYSVGATLRTYKLAIAVTGEFYVANGNTNVAAQAAVVSLVNSLKAVYEKEVSISFNLVATKLYTNAATDPFDPNAASLPSEASNAFDALAISDPANFALNKYDLGHVLNDGAGGAAMLGSPCTNTSFKAAAWSGSTTTSFITFIHEMGHQFSANHTFNSISGGCGPQYAANAAYEPGSGSTYLTYSGGCPPDDLLGANAQTRTYFHTNSLQSIIEYATNFGTCSVNTATGNTAPVANVGTAYTIPKNTPFVLKGSGTDANGDVIYYNWEQYDLGTTTGGAAAAAGSTDSPIFRSYDPSPNGNIRSFPMLSMVLAGNTPSNDEALPTVGRTLTFRLTARDKKALGGGTHCASVVITVSGTAGPLAVTAPNGGETIAAGSSQTLTWAVNNTNTLSANVNLYFSIDGGNTFPYLLASNTPNDGTETLTIPAGVSASTQARFKVVSTNGTTAEFYDISNTNFTITSTCQATSSQICPTNTITNEAGNAVFNLGLDNVSSVSLAANSATYAWTGTVANPIVNYTTDNFTTCQLLNAQPQQSILITFRVSQSGSYTIGAVGDNLAGSMPFSIFTNQTYTCANFVGANSYGGIQWEPSRAITLNACTTYYLLIYSTPFGNPNNVTLTIQGAGDVYEAYDNPANYSYTYVAVNQTNGQISAISATSDFTSLGQGNYNVYGLQYKNGVNPTTFLNQTQTQAFNSGSCIMFSGNYKTLNITASTCPQTLTLTNPTNNSSAGTITAKANQTITATNIITGGNVTHQAGNSVQLNPGFQVSGGAVYVTKILAGCN